LPPGLLLWSIYSGLLNLRKPYGYIIIVTRFLHGVQKLLNEANRIVRTPTGSLETGLRRAGTHQKSLLPLTACVPELRTLTVDTMSSCSYLQNLLTISVSLSSSSHSSTAPVGNEVRGTSEGKHNLELYQDSNSIVGLKQSLSLN
jgi:hypothetical protein